MVHHEKYKRNWIMSGFPAIDRIKSGFQKSELILIASCPGMGKTLLTLHMIVNIAVKDKIPLGFISLEMSKEAVLQNILEIGTDINSGSLSVSEFHRFNDAAGNIYDAPLYLDDTPDMNIDSLIATIRKMKKENHVEIVCIDYLNLINLKSKPVAGSLLLETIPGMLKHLACELDIPIIALVQAHRNAEKRIPDFDDLEQGGRFMRQADLALFVQRREAEKNSNEAVVDVDLVIINPKTGSQSETNMQIPKRHEVVLELQSRRSKTTAISSRSETSESADQ